MQSTEKTQTVPLLYKWDSRDDSAANYDSLFKNALIEPIGEDYYQVMKRNGSEVVALNTLIPGPILGLYYWDRTAQPLNPGRFLLVVYVGPGNNVTLQVFNATVSPMVSVAAPGLLGPVSGDEGCFFQEFLYINGKADMIINVNNTAQVAQVVGDTWIVNALPTALKGGSMAYLDGYLFAFSGQFLGNSNLNDPTTWSASNMIAADSYADSILRIARVGPYIVTFGAESIQYFYDAANPTGSPLAVNVGATKHIGFLGGFASVGDDNYFIGQAANGSPSLYKMSGLKVEAIVSLPFARMWIAEYGKLNNTFLAPDGALLVLNGHSCYYVRSASAAFPFPGPGPTPTGASYIYDLDSGIWSKLGYQAQESYLIKTYTQFVGIVGSKLMTYVARLTGTDVLRFSPTTYQDSGANFEVKFRTKPYNFGTNRVKFGARLLVVGDQTLTTSIANISWSDDDYKTTSTPRPVDMQFAYQQLYALGSFRKRSFTMTYSDNFPMRWQSIELDFDQGSA